jgi:DNA-binding transcriptional regulator YbjK
VREREQAPARSRARESEPHVGAAAKIRYRGRTARQTESRERQRAILEATLRLIVRDGMRGVRHRAIAQEAGVPLAATTYYFKDLSDLIADAFNLYVEDTLRDSEDLERSSLAALERHTGEALRTQEVREELARTLTRHLTAHIRAQVRRRGDRILEHAFRNEALRNARLAAISQIPQARTLTTIAAFLSRCGSSDPDADAQILFGFILSLEYQVLLGAVDETLIERSVGRLARHVLGVADS